MARRMGYIELKLSSEVQYFRILFYSLLISVYTPIFICLIQFDLPRLVKWFLWISVVLSLFCVPCFVSAILVHCFITSKRNRDNNPVLGVSCQPRMLAQEARFLLPQISQLPVPPLSSTTDMEQPDTISLHMATDFLVIDPSTSDAEQPSNMFLAEINCPVLDCSDVDGTNNNFLQTSISSTI